MRIDPDKLPLPSEPYRGILPFRLLDWRIFLERDVETERLGNLISMYGGVLFYGQSGAGKSSLLNAGLLPDALRRGRAPERIRVFPECGRELVVERIHVQEDDASLISKNELPRYLPSRFTSADNDERVALSCENFLKAFRAPSDLGVPLLIFDQFEELVTLFEENPKDEKRFKEAREARAAIEQLLCELLLNDPLPLKIVFTFRDDYLARLTPLFSRIPNLMDQAVRLAPPRVEVVNKIVRGPFVPSGDGERGLPGHFEDELSDELAEKIAAGVRARRASGVVNLSEVQTLCLALWRQPQRREELLHAHDPPAVLENIIVSEAMAVLGKFFIWDQIRALALLSNLVTKDGTRDVVSEENLISETRRNPIIWILRGDLAKLLKRLVGESGLLRRSLSSGTPYYELASEFLIPWIQRQQRRFGKLGLVIWGYIFAGLLLLLVLVGYFAYRAESQKNEAVAATQRATDALEELKRANAAVDDQRQRAEAGEKSAKEEKDKAFAAKQAADELINFMQYDLRDTLDKLGRLDMMKAINGRIRKYHEDHPPEASDLDARREIAVSFVQQGDLQRDQNDLSGALKCYRDSLDIAEKLGKQDPGNAKWQRDRSVSYNKVGDVQQAQGDLYGALKSYRDSLAIVEKLAKQDLGNAEWQRDLSVSYNKVGDVQQAQRDLSGALKSYRDSLAIREKLAKQDPGNAEWQRDLSVSYERVGDVQQAQGDLSGALKSSRDSLTIREKLAKQDPGNAQWQLDLAYSARNVARVLVKRKKAREAKPLFERFRDIADKLGRSDPANYFVQTDRANSRAYIAQCEDQKTPEGRARARALLQEGVKILETLKRHIGLQPMHESWLRDYQEELNALEKRANQRE